VTIRAFRLHLQYEDKAVGRAMNLAHFGVTNWVNLRLNEIHQLLRGPEAKGVNIVNVYFFENESHCKPCRSWYRLINAFEYKIVYNIKSLIDRDSVENIRDLLQVASALCIVAPWPQVRAMGTVLQKPLNEEDERNLRRCLAEWSMVVENAKGESNVSQLN
jgi:hypothetical protein